MHSVSTSGTLREQTPTRPPFVAFFSGLQPEGGGLSVAARLAWEALASVYAKDGQLLSALCYGDFCDPARAATGRFVHARSKGEAVVKALALRGRGNLLLFWHVGLLKLLPFVAGRESRAVLALMGIEAWKRPSRLTQRLLGKVDVFLPISQHTWLRFCEMNPALVEKPHCIIHLGLGSPITNAPQPDSVPTVVMISRLARSEDYKGHREVIEAWPALLARVPSARLWIAGDGDLRGDLERLVASRGLESHVRFWGWVSEEKKEKLIARSHCLALPSRGEGFGLVYLEAMRLGRPCLVSTLDAGSEVVNPPEAGIAVDPGDREKLVSALGALITAGPEWGRFSVQAKRRYDRLFTAQHFQQRLVEALSLG